MPDSFDGFASEGLEFLAELGASDKAWFDANRTAYQRLVVEPTKAFVAAIGERLAMVSHPRSWPSPRPTDRLPRSTTT